MFLLHGTWGEEGRRWRTEEDGDPVGDAVVKDLRSKKLLSRYSLSSTSRLRISSDVKLIYVENVRTMSYHPILAHKALGQQPPAHKTRTLYPPTWQECCRFPALTLIEFACSIMDGTGPFLLFLFVASLGIRYSLPNLRCRAVSKSQPFQKGNRSCTVPLRQPGCCLAFCRHNHWVRPFRHEHTHNLWRRWT